MNKHFPVNGRKLTPRDIIAIFGGLEENDDEREKLPYSLDSYAYKLIGESSEFENVDKGVTVKLPFDIDKANFNYGAISTSLDSKNIYEPYIATASINSDGNKFLRWYNITPHSTYDVQTKASRMYWRHYDRTTWNDVLDENYDAFDDWSASLTQAIPYWVYYDSKNTYSQESIENYNDADGAIPQNIAEILDDISIYGINPSYVAYLGCVKHMYALSTNNTIDPGTMEGFKNTMEHYTSSVEDEEVVRKLSNMTCSVDCVILGSSDEASDERGLHTQLVYSIGTKKGGLHYWWLLCIPKSQNNTGYIYEYCINLRRGGYGDSPTCFYLYHMPMPITITCYMYVANNPFKCAEWMPDSMGILCDTGQILVNPTTRFNTGATPAWERHGYYTGAYTKSTGWTYEGYTEGNGYYIFSNSVTVYALNGSERLTVFASSMGDVQRLWYGYKAKYRQTLSNPTEWPAKFSGAECVFVITEGVKGGTYVAQSSYTVGNSIWGIFSKFINKSTTSLCVNNTNMHPCTSESKLQAKYFPGITFEQGRRDWAYNVTTPLFQNEAEGNLRSTTDKNGKNIIVMDNAAFMHPNQYVLYPDYNWGTIGGFVRDIEWNSIFNGGKITISFVFEMLACETSLVNSFYNSSGTPVSAACDLVKNWYNNDNNFFKHWLSGNSDSWYSGDITTRDAEKFCISGSLIGRTKNIPEY